MKPRVLMVGRTRYTLPLDPALERKFGALRETTRPSRARRPRRGVRPTGTTTFALQRGTPDPPLDGPAFYGALPLRIARELRRGRADAILAQSPYEALAALRRPRARPERRAGRRRDPRRLADLVAALRLAGRAPSSRRSPIAPRSSRFATRTPCARCRRSRAGSFAGRRRAGRHVHDLHRPDCVLRAAGRPASGRPSRSSSASSSATRTSTRSPRRGGWPPRASRRRGFGSSATDATETSPRRSFAISPAG